MILRYTLNNDIEGEHICTYSPKGWQETELVLKRHDKYDGIFKDYTVKAEFFCGAGKEYIDNIYETQGVESVVNILIEMDCEDNGEYVELYKGRIIMKSYEKVQAAPEYTRVNLEQDGILQTVLNRLEAKVKLNSLETIDGSTLGTLAYAPYELTMHSKELFFKGVFVNDEIRNVFTWNDENAHTIPLQIEVDEIDELESPSLYDVGEPIFINPEDYSRNITVSGRIKLSVQQTSVINDGHGGITIHNYSGGFVVSIAVCDSEDACATTILHTESVVLTSSALVFDFNISQNIDVPAGHTVRLAYVNTYELSLTGDDGFVVSRVQNYEYFDETGVLLEEESITEESISNAFAVFETGAQIARVITDQEDAFRSSYFGRTNSQPYSYSENGCGSFTAITNGFQIRGFPLEDTTIGDDNISGRPVYMSMKEYFDGLNAIYCLGLGIKQEGDNTYIEVEPKDYFYSDDVLFSLGNIKNLNTKVDQKYFYNIVKVGYNKWRKEGTNGLDEFCTKHEYITLHKNISQTLEAGSDFIAAPYAIERQRRQQFVDSYTKDEEYDNDNFIICLNRDLDGLGNPSNLMEAEKNENFPTVTNEFSPSTIYNLRISPARNFRNWFKIISTGIIKLNNRLKDIKFSFAEGNYKMTSQAIGSCDPAQNALIGEGNDIELIIPGSDSYEPIFTGEVDEFEVPFSLSQYQTLKSLDVEGNPNYYKQIEYSTTLLDYLAGYILEFRWKPIRGKAIFKMARAYNRSEGCSHIYVEEGYVECGYVE